MNDLESLRRSWNKGQHLFKKTLLESCDHLKALEMFGVQHGLLHSAQVRPDLPWSYEDRLMDGLSESQVKEVPSGKLHSIAWCLWHIARIEDVTMNILVAGRRQLFLEEKWQARLAVAETGTGYASDEEPVQELSRALDIQSLLTYRARVGAVTQQTVLNLPAGVMRCKIDPHRLQQVFDEGAAGEEAAGLLEYWGRRTIAGLLLMPATRHIFVHMNEAQGIRRLVAS
jgi:hypothetical protein